VRIQKCKVCGKQISRGSSGRCRRCEDERKRIETPRGKNSHLWKGDKAKYWAKHRWLDRNYGKPDRCENNPEHKSKVYDWANISGEYKRDRSDYKMLCRSCHIRYDRRKACFKGHERTIKNTIIDKHGTRICKICKKIKDHRYYLKHKEKLKLIRR